MIDPAQYPKLKKGAEYLFEYGPERKLTRGRLIFAQSAKGRFYDSNDKLVFTKVVARRAAFEPVEAADRWRVWRTSLPLKGDQEVHFRQQKLRVYAVHLEAGRFAIHKAAGR